MFSIMNTMGSVLTHQQRTNSTGQFTITGASKTFTNQSGYTVYEFYNAGTNTIQYTNASGATIYVFACGGGTTTTGGEVIQKSITLLGDDIIDIVIGQGKFTNVNTPDSNTTLSFINNTITNIVAHGGWGSLSTGVSCALPGISTHTGVISRFGVSDSGTLYPNNGYNGNGGGGGGWVHGNTGVVFIAILETYTQTKL